MNVMGNPLTDRILVIGAGGFIGRHIFAALIDAGLEPVAAVRRPAPFRRMFPGSNVLACDMAQDVDPETWHARLSGIAAVINCVGVLSGRSSHEIHVDGPRALHIACEKASMQRVIHISAISARVDAGTSYAAEKMAAEDDLRTRNLDWVILRPSLVYADGTHGGTSVLRGLAGLPGFITLPGDGEQSFSPIHADDLARAILQLLHPAAPTRIVLEPVGQT